MLIRSCKVALIAVLALLYALFAIANIDDYENARTAVGHVMSMDTVFAESTMTWRALTDTVWHNIALWIIIFWQALTALLLLLGAISLWGERDSGPAFQQAKGLAVLGLTSGILLYLLGFFVVGAEWFAMWQSEDWNVQQASFRFLVITGLVMLFVLHRDDHAADR